MPLPRNPGEFPDVVAIVVAAGKGERAGPGLPKQYRYLGGVPLLAVTIEALAKSLPGARLVPVIARDAAGLYIAATGALSASTKQSLSEPIIGGDTRQASILAGLEASTKISTHLKIVLIHDVARPFLDNGLIVRAVESARLYGACAPAIALTDTIKQVDSTLRVVATPGRALLRAVQTPQAFRLTLILDAHRRAAAAGVDNLTDDAAVAEWAGYPVQLFEGDPDNMKVTTMADFARAGARVLEQRPDIRIGQGFDVHAFAPGDHVWLGGVKIAHDAGLSGHSDADVVIHAICDAIYGALCEGDIGVHFPPGESRWEGVSSAVFLLHAAECVRVRRGVIAHIDATLVCETPKLTPHRDAIRVRLADILGIEIGRVSIKATTSERLGFTGRGEGIAAMATATLRLPAGGGP